MASVSNDLLWHLVNKNSSFIVKRRQAGGVVASRDPLNLTARYTKSQSGFANSKAVGVVVNKDGNIQLLTKTQKNANKPSKAVSTTTFKQYKSARKVAAAVSKATRGYRNDLVEDAVLKASALTRARVAKKSYPVPVRGQN